MSFGSGFNGSNMPGMPNAAVFAGAAQAAKTAAQKEVKQKKDDAKTATPKKGQASSQTQGAESLQHFAGINGFSPEELAMAGIIAAFERSDLPNQANEAHKELEELGLGNNEALALAVSTRLADRALGTPVISG